MAQRIKVIPAEHHITMVENVVLARALAKEADIGKPVPTKWYPEVLAMVYRLKKAGRRVARTLPGEPSRFV